MDGRKINEDYSCLYSSPTWLNCVGSEVLNYAGTFRDDMQAIRHYVSEFLNKVVITGRLNHGNVTPKKKAENRS